MKIFHWKTEKVSFDRNLRKCPARFYINLRQRKLHHAIFSFSVPRGTPKRAPVEWTLLCYDRLSHNYGWLKMFTVLYISTSVFYHLIISIYITNISCLEFSLGTWYMSLPFKAVSGVNLKASKIFSFSLILSSLFLLQNVERRQNESLYETF